MVKIHDHHRFISSCNWAHSCYIYLPGAKKTPEEILTSAYYKLFARPVTSWNVRVPENEGLHTESLTDLWNSLGTYNTNAFIIK